MALVICPDCSSQVSDAAPACPRCGRPIAGSDNRRTSSERDAVASPDTSRKLGLGWKIGIFFAWFALFSQPRLVQLMAGIGMVVVALWLNKRRALRAHLALVGGAVGGGHYANWGLFFYFLPLGLLIFGGISVVVGAMHAVGVRGGSMEWLAPATTEASGVVAEGSSSRQTQDSPIPPAFDADRKKHERDPQMPAAQMVRIPPGTFVMGDDHDAASKPTHTVTISQPFMIDKTEVTVGAYARCVSNGACKPPKLHWPSMDKAGFDHYSPSCNRIDDPAKQEHPINCVDQAEAEAYCAFAGRRLPSESEWEYASRGTDGRTYPWGEDEPSCSRAVSGGLPGACGARKGTFAVESAPKGASPFGLLDMTGNVWEWVADGWHDYQDGESTDPPPVAKATNGVLRGGGWGFPTKARSATRLKFNAATGHVETGFRCAASISPSSSSQASVFPSAPSIPVVAAGDLPKAPSGAEGAKKNHPLSAHVSGVVMVADNTGLLFNPNHNSIATIASVTAYPAPGEGAYFAHLLEGQSVSLSCDHANVMKANPDDPLYQFYGCVHDAER